MQYLTKSIIVAGALVCLTGSTLAAPEISVDPDHIGPPVRVHYGTEKAVTITVTNTGDATLEITEIQGVKAILTGIDWLGVSVGSLSVPSGGSNTATFEIILNKGGVLTYTPGTLYLLSGVVFLKSNAPAPNDSVAIPLSQIELTDTTQLPPVWHTLSTACTRLVVNDRGEVGQSGRGGVNLDYVGLGTDCDTSADTYLHSGGPTVIRKNGTSYIFNAAHWQNPSRDFTPFNQGTPAGTISGPEYTGFYTGTFVNEDSSVRVMRTYYAPTMVDSCNFIVQKTVFVATNAPRQNITLGEIVDWDVPSDSGLKNTNKILTSKAIVYQQGIGTSGCQPNENRYAAVAFLGMYSQTQLLTDPCFNDRNFYGAFSCPNDSLYRVDSLGNSDEGKYFWNVTGALSGLSAFAGPRDYSTVFTYRHNTTLDTLTAYTALISVKNGDASALNSSIDKARAFYKNTIRGCDSITNCCLANSIDGRTGNVDCSPDGKVDISDLARIIDCLFFPWPWPNPCFCCPEAANMDGDMSGGFDISDLSALIDYLYISFTPLAHCPTGGWW